MARFKYSVMGLDPDKTVLASGREMKISHKHAREICNAIRGKLVDRAKEYLEEVVAMKRSVPFKRHH
ncbi:MAG: uL22 family ribosomal protein, partial [Candidatus Kariarchaeaceae archaeon]